MTSGEDLMVEALISAFMAQEGAHDSGIDPDVAVRATENIASSLTRMDPAGQGRASRPRTEGVG